MRTEAKMRVVTIATAIVTTAIIIPVILSNSRSAESAARDWSMAKQNWFHCDKPRESIHGIQAGAHERIFDGGYQDICTIK